MSNIVVVAAELEPGRAGPVLVGKQKGSESKYFFLLVGVSKALAECDRAWIFRPALPSTLSSNDTCRECGHGNSVLDADRDDLAPAVLTGGDLLGEEVVEQQVGQLRVGRERRLDLAQKHTADDAAAPPHQGNGYTQQLHTITSQHNVNF